MKLLCQFFGYFLLLFIITFPSYGQNKIVRTSLNANLSPSLSLADSDSSEIKVIWIEDIDARTLYSSSYKSNDGQIKVVQSKRPLNYLNESRKLVPIDPSLKKDKSGWSAMDQPFPTYLHPDGSFSLTADNSNRISFGKNCSINGQSINNKFNSNGNSISFSNIVPGIEKQMDFYENAVKYNYVVQHSINTDQNTITFSEEIDLPKGFEIIPDLKNGKQSSHGWSGNLNILNSKGEIVSTIHSPLCFDNENDFMIASYKIKKENGKQILEIHVPTEWLNDPLRAYPVVIDPLVTGPTSTWSGGYMESCIMPTYNLDSIQVTIPAGITVTGLYVTASFYADPFTPATMSQGAMLFSTTCANSQSFTITGATGTSPGTAYLDSFNLFNPLTCCFPESCASQSFYLRMHLGRTGPGTGCNTTYIRYDPFTTLWPFKAVIVGRTAESFGAEWLVPQTPICSNNCTITGNAYSRYGVAPYTYSHPWSTEVVTQGVNTGCGTGTNSYQFTLTIPNCPNYCDTNFTSLSVPPPVIVDACGTVITGIPAEIVPIKTAPGFDLNYDTLICSEQPFTIDMTPCVPQTSFNWTGNNSSGSSDITGTIINTSTTVSSVNYQAIATANGCTSDTIDIPLYVQPLPIVNYTNDPLIVNPDVEVAFTDQTQINVGTIVLWEWDLGDGTGSLDQNPFYTYTEPGSYLVCLKVTNDNGCYDSLCKTIDVAPAEIIAPNVVTPNNDEINELLEFDFLEFYPENELSILNRWGNLIYHADGYKNDWNGAAYTEGTYFYILKIPELDKTYSGFFQIVK